MKKKRAIRNSFLILISIIFLTAGINFKAFAANGSKGGTSTSNSDLLEISKTAKAIHNERSDQLKDRSYKIDLNVKAKESSIKVSSPKDIILVLDKSGSMGPNYYYNSPINILKKSAINFSNNILNNSPDSKISIITFSENNEIKIYDLKLADNSYNDKTYKGKIKVYNREYGVVCHVDEYTKKTYAYVNYNGQLIYEDNVIFKNGSYYIKDSKNFYDDNGYNDAEIDVDFTNNKDKINNVVKNIESDGATNTQSALFKVKKQLGKVKDDNREKYVIFFTDGMPNRLCTEDSSGGDKYIMDQTIKTYNKIESQNPDVHFISLGFGRSFQNYAEYFLPKIQNYNKNIDPNSNGLIYIDNVNDIEKVYNKIEEKILTNITNNATITDIVPDGFEIVKGSEEPKGAIIENNKIMWSKQSIGKDNMTYTFRIKAKDTNFGTENLISDKNTVENPKVNISKDKDMMTNTEATVNYTYNLDNSKHTQTFNVPHVQVPNTGELNLIDNPRTYYYGEKIKLKDLIKDLNIKYGPEDGYTYIWSDNHGHSITLNNEKKNAKAGNTFDKNSTDNDSITLTDDTTFTLEIKRENNYDKDGKAILDLKDSVDIKVINPKVTIVKRVDGESNSNNVFSFKVTGNNNTWNLDLNQNSTFTLNNLKKGTYKLSEIDSQGYKLESIKINGKEVSLDNPSFSINDDNANIQIEIVNKKLSKSNYYNNTQIIKNEF